MIHVFDKSDINQKIDSLSMAGIHFKVSRASDKYVELDTWPMYSTASQAKEYITKMDIPMYTIDKDCNIVHTHTPYQYTT